MCKVTRIATCGVTLRALLVDLRATCLLRVGR
ncbi:hypothetical protein LINPERPRIM_LOCUS9203 [Linum perenne]